MSHPTPPASVPTPPWPAWPPQRVVAMLPGSLPMGGVVPGAPIHAFVRTPEPLALQHQPGLNPQRHDIDLGGLLAFVIDDVLTAGEADAVAAASEQFGYRDAAPGIATPPGMRMNKTVHWLADDALMGPMHARIAHLLPPQIDSARLTPRFSHRLNMYRYDADDEFNRHTDGDWPGYALDADRTAMREWPGTRSRLTMLLYLNGPLDGVQGGHTLLYDRQGGAIEVVPRKGSALFFRHGFGPGSVVHAGGRVHGSTPKVVARINVFYDTQGSSPALA